MGSVVDRLRPVRCGASHIPSAGEARGCAIGRQQYRKPRRHWTTWMARTRPAITVCAGDGRSSGLEKARCGDPDGNEYRAGLIQNPNAAFWRRDLFREFGDLAPYGAQAAEFDRAQRRNRLVVLYHLEIIALHDRLARRPTWRRRRVEPLRALPEWPKNGNLPGDYARQLVLIEHNLSLQSIGNSISGRQI